MIEKKKILSKAGAMLSATTDKSHPADSGRSAGSGHWQKGMGEVFNLVGALKDRGIAVDKAGNVVTAAKNSKDER